MPPNFEEKTYWHARFSEEQNFEWLIPGETFLDLSDTVLSTLDPATTKILHIGLGTSDLHCHLRKKGFSKVLNVDYEPLALERGQELEKAAFGDVVTEYDVADLRTMSLDRKFDLIIDKSTLDAISCGGDDAVRKTIIQVSKCLAEDGVWLCLSFSKTRFEVDGPYLDVSVLQKMLVPKERVGDPDVFYWLFVVRRKGKGKD